MKSMELIPRRIRGSFRIVSLCAAASAAVTMGIATVTSSLPGVGGHSAIVNADTVTSPIPATTPAVASAGPRVRATTFAGKDWPGMRWPK
jgi:hypothetical protein